MARVAASTVPGRPDVDARSTTPQTRGFEPACRASGGPRRALPRCTDRRRPAPRPSGRSPGRGPRGSAAPPSRPRPEAPPSAAGCRRSTPAARSSARCPGPGPRCAAAAGSGSPGRASRRAGRSDPARSSSAPVSSRPASRRPSRPGRVARSSSSCAANWPSLRRASPGAARGRVAGRTDDTPREYSGATLRRAALGRPRTRRADRLGAWIRESS